MAGSWPSATSFAKFSSHNKGIRGFFDLYLRNQLTWPPNAASMRSENWMPEGSARMAHGPRGGPVVVPVLDEISKQIIEQLQTDGRRSYAAIGKAVGLSEAAVRQRVQRLYETGVMQIVAVTDPLKLGFRRQAMIGLRCDGDLQQIADQLADMEEIDYVVLTAGSFDLLLEVVCEDDDHLLEILSRVRGLPSVTSTETFVYLKLRKQTYTWGTR
jgi:Lrp/AsnC family transcriptional regulator for asnA, asnC and gidA